MPRPCLLLPLLVLAIACQKKETLDFSLTPVTQTGANTLSCVVDGRVFRPYGRRCVNFGGGCSEGIDAYYNPKRGQLLISATLYTEDRDEQAGISGDSIFHTGEIYVMRPTAYHYASVSFSDRRQKLGWGSSPPARTSIVLTRLDTVARIISGTFEGDLKLSLLNPTNQKPLVQVTDGRFDITY